MIADTSLLVDLILYALDDLVLVDQEGRAFVVLARFSGEGHWGLHVDVGVTILVIRLDWLGRP